MTKSELKGRKELKAKLAVVLRDRLQSLPFEYQEFLLDDLVSAFENRFAVLSKVKMDAQSCLEVADVVIVEAQ